MQRAFPHFLLKSLRGALAVALTAWAVATATFLLMRAVPGGPLSQERRLPPAVAAAIEKHYHLDRPVWEQYLRYLGAAATGDFGPSYSMPGRSVGSIIAERVPVSARLGLLALAMTLAVSFPLGLAAAVWRGRWPDRLNGLFATLAVSVPSFILGAVLLYAFCQRLRWFPVTGASSLRGSILPAAALAAMPAAYLARLIRSETLEVMGGDFLRTARAKGVPGWRIVAVHALPHTLAPVLAYLGPLIAGILTGSFVIELIFDIPGLGRFFVSSISNRDYPMIMGVTLVYTLLLIVMNLTTDALARLIDPRLGEGAKR